MTQTTELVRFTPDRRAGDAAPPVYLLKTPSVFDRALFEAELDRYGAVYPPESRLFEEARAAVEASGATDKGVVLDLIDSVEATTQAIAPDTDVDDSNTARWEDLERTLIETWPPYARLVASRSKYLRLMPLVAAQRFLKGWENGPCEFRMGGDGLVPEPMLALLPASDLMAIGGKLRRLMYVTQEEEKNSEPPSSSEADRPSSPAAGEASAEKGSSSTLATGERRSRKKTRG